MSNKHKIETDYGYILKSGISNCPIFLTKELRTKSNNNNLESKLENINVKNAYNKILSRYMLRFIAGDSNMSNGFADITNKEVLLGVNNSCKNNKILKINSTIDKFERCIQYLNKQNQISINDVIKVQKILLNKNSKLGIRNIQIRAGNPKINPYAFYCSPTIELSRLLKNFFHYFNANESNYLDRSFEIILQFILIHPFYDANGRISRLLFIALSSKKHKSINIYILLIYLKIINKKGYYKSIKKHILGKNKSVENINLLAIKWANHSFKILESFFDEYENIVGIEKINNNQHYSQVVINAEVNHKMDERIFKFHKNKGGENIYINTGILNVLNQFDYYLRFELRKHQSNA